MVTESPSYCFQAPGLQGWALPAAEPWGLVVDAFYTAATRLPVLCIADSAPGDPPPALDHWVAPREALFMDPAAGAELAAVLKATLRALHMPVTDPPDPVVAMFRAALGGLPAAPFCLNEANRWQEGCRNA